MDARRYVEALRRRAGLLASVALGVGVLVLAVSLALPKSYTATAKISPSAQTSSSSPSNTSGTPSTQPDLATTQAYITSPAVLAAAALNLPRTTVATLQDKITTSASPNSNIVDITATDSKASHPAQLANQVAQSFLSVRAAAERAQLAAQEAALTSRLAAARAQGSGGLAAALEQQISNLAAQEASAGSDLQLLAAAQTPTSPSSPAPVRDAAIAFFATLFLGVLAVGGRELLSPSVSSSRELSVLIGAPVLGRVPSGPLAPLDAAHPASRADAEAYRFIANLIGLRDRPRRPHLIALTSPVSDEARTTVALRLAGALVNADARTLLVSVNPPQLPPVTESGPAENEPPVAGGADIELRADADVLPLTEVRPRLTVLDSTALPSEATNDSVQTLCERIRQADFDYVLFDLAPLNETAATQLYVRHADTTIVLYFSGHTTAEQLSRARELLDRLDVVPAGIVEVTNGAEGKPRRTRPSVTSLRAQLIERAENADPGPAVAPLTRGWPHQPRSGRRATRDDASGASR